MKYYSEEARAHRDYVNSIINERDAMRVELYTLKAAAKNLLSSWDDVRSGESWILEVLYPDIQKIADIVEGERR